MYQNILVPISFEADRDARKALDVAQILCSESGKITALHVVEHPPEYASGLLPENHLEVAKKAIGEKLGLLVGGMTNTYIRIVEGHSGRTILDFATSHQADCIVIASHRPGLQDYLLGSTAARVVRHAACAVHVVR